MRAFFYVYSIGCVTTQSVHGCVGQCVYGVRGAVCV